MNEELCINCDETTGNAGRCDDSLFTDDGKGPFCQRCYQYETRIENLGSQVSYLQTQLWEMRNIITYAIMPPSIRTASMTKPWAQTGELEMKKHCDIPHCNKINCGIDPCIKPMVKALNAAGIETVASCCGHGNTIGTIALKDGRELMIAADYDTARRLEKYFGNIHGDSTSN